jgi:hypothetical protein
MINFLRRIRRNLINENKPSIYLIYALGEFVLVVFGILIALQIDNWNENQKLLRLEKEILGEIKNGLESDYETVSRAIEDHLVYINSQNIIVDWIDRKYPFHDSLVPHFKHTFWTTLFLPHDAQFESLKQFGIRNISNKELSDRISYLYDYEYENILFWQNEYKKTSIDFRNTLDELGFEFVRDSSQILLDVQPINPEALQLNKAYFYNLMITSGTLLVYTEFKLKLAQKEIEKTLEMLEKELSQE